MSVRTFILRTLLVGIALLLMVALGEWWLRSRVFGDDPAYADWRDPCLYTWSYPVDQRTVHRGDDHDKLAIRWGLMKPSTDHPHALLGWCGGLDSATLLPKGFSTEGTERPLVFLGGGWSEHHLVPDTGAATLDLSVPGFSLDQDLLLFDTTRGHYRGAHVLLLIDLDRLDHLQRAFVGRPKPWFTLGAYAGDLHGVPVTKDIATYLDAHPADPGLYSYHLFRTRVLHDTVMSGSAIDGTERELWELSKKLLFVLLQRAREDSIAVSVFFEQHSLGALADRRRWALQVVCRDLGVNSHVLAEEAFAIHLKDQVAMAAAFVRSTVGGSGSPRFSSLSQLQTLQEGPEGARSTLERNMVTILKDPRWLEQVRRKAAEAQVPLATMVQRDAQYMLDHAPR